MIKTINVQMDSYLNIVQGFAKWTESNTDVLKTKEDFINYCNKLSKQELADFIYMCDGVQKLVDQYLIEAMPILFKLSELFDEK